MKINSFEDIIAWKKAKDLTIKTYSLFKNLRDFEFRSQILRASVSIMNNIAEGFERMTDKDLRNFLYIAKGSCGEYRSMIHLAYALHYINSEEMINLREESVEISRIISGFIKTLCKK